jgi:hypothetical protein
LSSLVKVVTADANGDGIGNLIPEASAGALEALSETGLRATLDALTGQGLNGERLFERMSTTFDGMLAAGRARVEAGGAERFGGGEVAILRNSLWSGTESRLLRSGTRVLILVDEKDRDELREADLRVVRHPSETLRLDHPDVIAIIAAAKEQLGDGGDRWVLDDDGSELSWGTYDQPASRASAVDPVMLAQTIARLLAPAGSAH